MCCCLWLGDVWRKITTYRAEGQLMLNWIGSTIGVVTMLGDRVVIYWTVHTCCTDCHDEADLCLCSASWITPHLKYLFIDKTPLQEVYLRV